MIQYPFPHGQTQKINRCKDICAAGFGRGQLQQKPLACKPFR
jgi:hypothetical protein